MQEFNVDFGEVINTGSGAVNSVNGKTGDVVLDASDVGALPDSTAIPTKNSELINDSNYQTNTQVNSAIATHNSTNNAHSDIRQLITDEATARVSGDNNLQGQIDAITAGSDVKDIVGTYAELQAYDTTHLGDNDIIKVLQDEEHDDETTYYRYNKTTDSFTLIGEEGPYYTKAAADSQFVPQTRTVNNKALSSNISLNASDVSALPSSTKYGASIDASGTTLSLKDQDGNTLGTTTTQDTTYTAGSNVSISANNEISATDTTYSNFTGTDGQTAGASGLVPAPATTDADKFLKSDGTWDTAGGGGGPTVVQTTGTSQTDVMSQNATTGMVFASPGTSSSAIRIGNNPSAAVGLYGVFIGYGAGGAIGVGDCIAIGRTASAKGESSIALCHQAKVTANRSIAIGFGTSHSNINGPAPSGATPIATIAIGPEAAANNSWSTAVGQRAWAYYTGSVAIGAGSKPTRAGEMNIGSQYTSYGYNNTNYRILTGLHDGIDNHSAATVAQGNTLATSAPTTATEGVLGQLYTDTTNMHTYQCTAINGSEYTWTQRW